MDEQNETQEAAANTDDQPKYTQKQLNDLIAKESDKRLTKVLKEYGFESREALAALIEAKTKTDNDLVAALERAEAAEKINAAPRNLGISTSRQQHLDSPDLSALVRARM